MKKGCIIFLILNVLTTSALFVGGFILNSEEQESDKQSSKIVYHPKIIYHT